MREKNLALLMLEEKASLKLQLRILLDFTLPEKWSTAYRVSLDGDQSSSQGIQFIEEDDKQRLLYINYTAADKACFPGTSGSPIVNKDGLVQGALIAISVEEINSDTASRFSLAADLIGKKIAYYYAINTKYIKGLIRD